MKRVVTGAVLAVVTFTGVLLAPSWMVWLVVVLLAVVGASEMKCFVARETTPGWVARLPVVVAPLVVLSFAPFRMPAELHPAAIGGVLFAPFVVAALAGATGGALRGLFLATYLGLTLAAVGSIADLTSPAGRFLLTVGLIAVYSGDTGAYYGGRRFGRRKLAPQISPGKTVEGAFFGLASSGLAAAVASFFLLPELGPPRAFLVGVALGLTGIGGDLVESAMKRSAGVKDSGSLLPGHGGMLDRIDSFLLAAPLLYFFARLFGGGGG